MDYALYLLQMAAGAGLLYFGIQSLSTAAQRLGSGPFRHFVRKHLHRIWLGSLWGMALNALIGSNTVISLILVGFISGGVLAFSQAYPISIWGNLGGILILYLATINFQWIALLLLAVGGLSYAFSKNPTFRLFSEAIVGLGLLLYGMTLMSATSKQFGITLPEELFYYSLLLVPVGFIIQILCQSGLFVVLLALHAYATGHIGLAEVIFLQCGLNLGRSFNTWMVSLRTTGIEKQMLMLPVLFHLLGSVIFTIINTIETYLHIPLVQWLLHHMTSNLSLQVPHFSLIYCLVTCTLMMVMQPRIMNWLEIRYPPSDEEQLGLPRFLIYAPINDTSLALDLVEKEQLRLIERLPDYLQNLRSDQPIQPPPVIVEHKALTALCDQIHHFLLDLLQQEATSPHDASRLFSVLERQQLLASLVRALYQFTSITPPKSPEVVHFVSTLIESVDFFLLQLHDELSHPHDDSLAILQGLTSEKREVLQQIRDACLQQQTALSIEDKHTLFTLGITFERITWLIHQMAQRG